MRKKGKSNEFDPLSEIYNSQKEFDVPKQKKPISKSIAEYFSQPNKIEQWVSAAVIIIGIGGLFFGMISIKGQLTANDQAPSVSDNQLARDDQPGQDLLGLRGKDTDQDGLSDYDEMNVYNTSPYLPDTDSDGVSDSKEIVNQTDPNCPAGKNCFDFIEPTAFNQPADDLNELV